MASNSNEYTPQQYRKYNGQTVFKALSAMGNVATAEELADFISQDIGLREDTILSEIKLVLRRGITNGFLERKGNIYSAIRGDVNMEMDSAPRRKARSSRNTAGPSRRTTPANVVDDDSEFDDSDEDDGSEDDAHDEDMQTDGPAQRRPRVKLYEVYEPPSSDEDIDDEQPPQKRIRLRSNLKKNVRRS